MTAACSRARWRPKREWRASSVQDHAYLEQARRIRIRLFDELQTLNLLERELRQRRDQDAREWTRADKVAVAIEHLQQAMAALELASQK
jgi:hypothetical protein